MKQSDSTSDTSDRATHEPSPEGLGHSVSVPSAACDSTVYRHTFYGILNKEGQFWTPMPFHDKDAATEHLSRWAKGSYKSMLKTHKIVPVRIRLETLAAQAIEARSDQTEGLDPEGESAVRQDAPEVQS
jgi:hypothetical protein